MDSDNLLVVYYAEFLWVCSFRELRKSFHLITVFLSCKIGCHIEKFQQLQISSVSYMETNS